MVSKVPSSTEWRLGENVVLWLMECLTPSVSFDIFMSNYFTSFRLLILLGVNNIQATRVLKKNRLRKCTIIGDKQLQKKELWTERIKQKSSVTLTLVAYNDSSVIYITSFESWESKKFVQCWNKVEKKIQEQKPNQFHCYNKNMGLVNRMD